MEEPIEIDVAPSSGFDALLQVAFSNETKVPETILRRIPPPTVTVSSLLATNLPALVHSSAVDLRPAKLCITDLAAHWTVEELLRAPIPPRKWLGDLEITLKSKWFTCARVTSVLHPKISNLYLPLWVGNFWYSLVEAAEQKKKWRKAVGWVSGQVQDAGAYEARELMGRIPWGTRLWVLVGADSSSFVGVLAKLLSDNWLVERHLDTLISYLNFRAGEDRKGAGECWVGDVYFSACLKRFYRATKKAISTDWDLNKYKDAITAHGYKRLLFPANLNNTHWIAFSVDLEKKEFCFGTPSYHFGMNTGSLTALHDLGDSLSREPDTEVQHVRRGLANWLKAVFGSAFKDLGSTFLIGRQEDGHSCGICVVNAIEHAMFGAPLFTDGDRYRLRVRYFVEAIKYLLNDVGACFALGGNHTHVSFSSLPSPLAKALLNQWTHRTKESTRQQEL